MTDAVIYAWRAEQGDVWTGEWALDRADKWVPAEANKYILAAPVALAASPEVQALIAAERDAWREEPESSEAWCAGNQHVLDRLCVVAGADPATVQWDGSDGSLNEETDALIWRILRHNDDDDGLSPRERALIADAEARAAREAYRKACVAVQIVISRNTPDDGGDADPCLIDQLEAVEGLIKREAAALRGETP